jgi:hypothetical protein
LPSAPPRVRRHARDERQPHLSESRAAARAQAREEAEARALQAQREAARAAALQKQKPISWGGLQAKRLEIERIRREIEARKKR